MTPPRAGRHGARVAISTLAAMLVTAACSAADGGGAGSTSTTVVSVDSAPSTTVPASVPTTVAPTTTEPLPVLAERFTSVEVSARIMSGVVTRVVSIVATESALAEVPDPGDPSEAAAWCSGVGGVSTDPFVVRISGEAVGTVDGGIEGFELTSDQPVPVGPADADAPSDPVPASLHLELDDGDLVASDALLTLAGETTGTFRAETPDGDLVEGAFRCT